MTIFKKFFQTKETITVEDTKVNSSAEHKVPKQFMPEEKGEGCTEEVMNVFHLIVLDESGSMSGVTMQTISGCNETLQTVREMQRLNPQEQCHFVSIYAFDTENSRYILKDVSIQKAAEITSRDYSPYGGTPLFDALVDTLTELREKVDGKQSMGYVTIITDGYENASRRYNIDDVKRLIDELKGKGVIFSFVGANIDAAEYAKSMHIDNAMQFEQTDEGTEEMWLRERRGKMRSNAKMRMMRRYGEEEDLSGFAMRENRGNYYSIAPQERITPDVVTKLGPNEIFVFGSDMMGSHNGGAAKFAVENFGAIRGQAFGPQGQSFAIPTVGVDEEKLYHLIVKFCFFAQNHPDLTFYVTPIGCGSAAWSPYIVAPMFAHAFTLPNVKLPEIFWEYCNE